MISPLRFLAVVYPVASLSFRTNSNARLAIGITWLVTLLSVRFLSCQTQRWCVNSKLRAWFEQGYFWCIFNFLCITLDLKEGFQIPSRRISPVNRGARGRGGGGLQLSPQARKQKRKQRGVGGYPLASKFCDWGFGARPQLSSYFSCKCCFSPFFHFHFLFSLFTLTFHFHFLSFFTFPVNAVPPQPGLARTQPHCGQFSWVAINNNITLMINKWAIINNKFK